MSYVANSVSDSCRRNKWRFYERLKMGVVTNQSDYFVWVEFKALYYEVRETIENFQKRLKGTVFTSEFTIDDEIALYRNYSETEITILKRIYNLCHEKCWDHFDHLFDVFVSSNSHVDLEIFKNAMESAILKFDSRESNFEAYKRTNAEERAIQVEIAKENLVKYRAIGLANGAKYFQEYLLELKILGMDRKWDLYDVVELIKEEFNNQDIGTGIQNFVDKSFRVINHPVVDMFCDGSLLKFETESAVYEYSFSVIKYRSYDLFSRKTIDGRTGLWTSTTQDRGAAIPWALRYAITDELSKQAKPIRIAKFTKPGHAINLISAMSHIYGDPTMSELIPLWFNYWEFFNYGQTCRSCGRDLTNPVSVVRGQGSWCGDHGYRLSGEDASGVKDLIEKLNRYRVLSNGSPLIESRVNNIQFKKPLDDLDWLDKMESKVLWDQEEILRQIRYRLSMRSRW